MRAARAEKGLVTCNILLDADDATTIHYHERWQTRQDLDDQLRSSRYDRLLALMESASERPSLEFNFISESHGLEYVETARNAGV